MSTGSLPVRIRPEALSAAMAQVPGWQLGGEGEGLFLEKAWRFAGHTQAMLFVNSLGWMAETLNHHPEVVLNHAHCVVRWCTHDVKGLSHLDFEAARRTDALAGTLT